MKAYIRHDRRDVLDKMTDLPMSLSLKLSTPISVDFYTSYTQASIMGKKCSSLTVPKGYTVPIYATAPSINEKYTKHAVMGQYLQGSVSFAKDEFGKKADTYALKYVLNESAKKDKNKSSSKKDVPSFAETMAEQKINWIGKMSSEEGLKMFEELKKDEAANQAQLRLARISGIQYFTLSLLNL